MVAPAELLGVASDLGFSISHQKVELDLDIASRSLYGRTEITINPLSPDLKTIRLNCRQCKPVRVRVNGRPSSLPTYDDPYNRTQLSFNSTVHQWDVLKAKLDKQLKLPPDEELPLNLPKHVTIKELDPLSSEAQTLTAPRTASTGKRDSTDGVGPDGTTNTGIGLEQTAKYTPITLYVEYVIQIIRDGLQFVGWEEGDLRYPHAYTKNSLSPGIACCLFPCLDDIAARCTWEISIKCARSIGDVFNTSSPVSEINPHAIGNHAPSSVQKSNGVPPTSNTDPIPFSEEDQALDLAVICSGDMTDEVGQYSCSSLLS